MACANWMLTVFAALIFVFTFWPSILGAGAAKWIIIVCAVLVVVVSWTGCKCTYCNK